MSAGTQRTATLANPRTAPVESVNRMKTRCVAGSNDTVPVRCTNTPNVAVAPLPMARRRRSCCPSL